MIKTKIHRRRATCWKRKNCEVCRMAFKGQLDFVTYLADLSAKKDEVTGKWLPMRKFPLDDDGDEAISDPVRFEEKSSVYV